MDLSRTFLSMFTKFRSYGRFLELAKTARRLPFLSVGFFGQLPKFDILETVGPNDLKFEVRIVLDRVPFFTFFLDHPSPHSKCHPVQTIHPTDLTLLPSSISI